MGYKKLKTLKNNPDRDVRDLMPTDSRDKPEYLAINHIGPNIAIAGNGKWARLDGSFITDRAEAIQYDSDLGDFARSL